MVKPTRNTSLRERFNISRLAIAYPWLTVGFWIAVTVAGILAFSSLKYALFPDITFPVVVVNATAPLDTALDTEAKLTQPLEQSLRSLEGIDDIRSSTYPGQTAVSLSFAVGTNLEQSSRKVETALKQIVLPEKASFKVIPFNLNESAAVSYAIKSSSKNLTELTKIAKEQIVPPIAKLPGVLKVELLGAPVESSLPQTATPLVGLSQSVSAVRFNGQDALAFQTIKRGNANTLEVVSQVEKEVARLQSTLPDVQLVMAASQADYIREATQATIDALILAVILSVVVIFPFLWNFPATLIAALAIPTSLLGTFIVMAIFRFNLETITLLALALVIGIIIDDAIVDVENIIRHIEQGETPRQAAISATNEIGLTVSAATFTIVAVFLPVGLMGGVVGQFFKPFGITVSAAVLTSLLVARTLSPVLAVYWLKPTSSSRRENNTWSGFAQHYRNLLNWSLAHRGMVLGLAVLSFIVGIGLIPLIPKGFIPKLDRGEFNIVYTAPSPLALSGSASPSASRETPSIASGNASRSPTSLGQSPLTLFLNQSRSVAQKLEAVVLRSPDVQSVFTIVGSRSGEPNKGTLYVKLKSDRTRHTALVQEQIRSSLPNLPGVTSSVEDIQFVDTGGGEKPIQVALLGNDLRSLSRAAKAIKTRIQALPGFVDVTATGESNEQGTIFEIEHQNSRRVAYVSANLGKDQTLGDATERVIAEAKAVLPPGVSLNLGGDSARSSEIFGSFGVTLGLSVLCILLVLILLFKSWLDPLVIVFSLPLSVVGAMVALLVTRSEFGMISLIGIIFLLGLVNKNAILLVDYINQLRSSGLNRTEAILKAGPLRLRPILMTTAATILGMLPIALGIGAGSELRSPMAVAIIGGLVASTLLSLIVVPVVYAMLDNWRLRILKGKRAN